MKNIVQFNGTLFGSTGSILRSLSSGLSGDFKFYDVTPDSDPQNGFCLTGSYFGRQWQKVLCQINGSDGFHSKLATKSLLKWLEVIKPNLLHFHNIHGCYCNLPMLVDYAINRRIPIVYTLHDAWTFTGRCGYFDVAHCDKWLFGCGHCPAKGQYPKARLFDSSAKQWKLKREILTGKGITFITPSKWLADFAKQSYLVNEDIRVINNGIDTNVFNDGGDQYKFDEPIDKKKIILSVAYPFGPNKGLNDLNALQGKIDLTRYQIVAVGVTNEDKTASGIYRIAPTKDKNLLASLYRRADVFVFFTHQDNYPTVLLESLACGCPVIAYDVGGCGEIVEDGRTGYLIKENDIDGALKALEKIDSIDRNDCRKAGQKHSIPAFVEEYRKLYEEKLK